MVNSTFWRVVSVHTARVRGGGWLEEKHLESWPGTTLYWQGVVLREKTKTVTVAVEMPRYVKS